MSDVMEMLNITDKPEVVWNVDEKGWSKQQCLQRPLLVSQGKTQVYLNKKKMLLSPVMGNVIDTT